MDLQHAAKAQIIGRDVQCAIGLRRLYGLHGAARVVAKGAGLGVRREEFDIQRGRPVWRPVIVALQDVAMRDDRALFGEDRNLGVSGADTVTV